MFNTTRRLIRLAIVGSAAYVLYKERPEQVQSVLDKVLPESVKKEIARTKEQYASMQELKESLSGVSEEVAKSAVQTAEQLFKTLQSEDAQEAFSKLGELRTQKKEHPEEFVPDTFTPREVELLMTELAEDRMGWSIRIMLRTGLNMYEILALKPSSIQADGSVIRVRNELRTKNGEPVILPLSRDKVRDVEVPAEARNAAKRLRKTDSEYIWQSRDSDMPIKPSSFTAQFKDHVGEVPQVRIFGPKVAVNTFEANT